MIAGGWRHQLFWGARGGLTELLPGAVAEGVRVGVENETDGDDGFAFAAVGIGVFAVDDLGDGIGCF